MTADTTSTTSAALDAANYGRAAPAALAAPEGANNGRDAAPDDVGAMVADQQQRLSLIDSTLAELTAHLDLDRTTNIGFPSTFDFDYTRLWPLFNYVLNNVGDPFRASAYPANTKHLEREVIHTFADLVRLPSDDRWGYVTTGGSEGIEWACSWPAPSTQTPSPSIQVKPARPPASLGCRR